MNWNILMKHYYIHSVYYSFNKQEEDFDTLAEYNDYLEEIEEISEYLVDGPFVRQWVSARIEQTW